MQGFNNPREEEIAMVLQAVAQGQDLSNFDPQLLSAAKQYSVMKANELNTMINSNELPPNVSREMMRNELDTYQGFADRMAEDDPQYAGMMDAAFIGAGLYVTAKYGPMAAAKLKTAGAATYGFGQNVASNLQGVAGTATSAMGGLGSKVAQGAATVGGYATGAAEGVVGAAGVGAQNVRDFGRGVTDNFGANRLGSAPGMMGYNRPYAAGQKTYGFGKNVLGGIARLGRKALLRF